MRRLSPWLSVVVLLVGALLVREPWLRKVDDLFLGWFLSESEARFTPAQVTLVEIGREDIEKMAPLGATKPRAKGMAGRRSLSPLEYALFLQAVETFQPAVVALEPIVIWRDRDKDQEQVFLDQAMRVPKLLVAIELGEKGPRDFPSDDLHSFMQVTGPRAGLADFPGVARRPDDDIRLIATPGFTNLPDDRSDQIRVPMLFTYRGEIVPSFPLQAILLWLKTTPADVKIELGSHILLPNGWKIPIDSEGTATINPHVAESLQHTTLSDLLLAAQEHGNKNSAAPNLNFLKDQIVLLRLTDDPLQPPNVFATAMAAIQKNAYVRRAAGAEWIGVVAVAIVALFLWRISKVNLVLGALALGAGYCLVVLSFLEQDRLWLPTFPLALLLGSLILVRLFAPDRSARKNRA